MRIGNRVARKNDRILESQVAEPGVKSRPVCLITRILLVAEDKGYGQVCVELDASVKLIERNRIDFPRKSCVKSIAVFNRLDQVLQSRRLPCIGSFYD